MTTISKSFSATGTSDQLGVNHGDALTYSVSGTFSATVQLERSDDGIRWEVVGSAITSSASGRIEVSHPTRGRYLYRFHCTVRASGTAVTSLADVDQSIVEFKDPSGASLFKVDESGVSTSVRVSQKRLIQVGAKVGATSGWLVSAADDKNSLARCPQSKTGVTLVVPISGLKVGDTISGFHLVGQIESGGNHVTVDADLRKQTAAAADLVDASVGAITQLDVVADTIISSSNTEKASLSDVIGVDETFYVLITATTNASTDIDLQAVAITVTEA
jgi:hypothetical protein